MNTLKPGDSSTDLAIGGTIHDIHEWQPVKGWCGRYRCPLCQAFGYNARSVLGFGGWSIVPYKCTKCSAWAVCKERVRPGGPKYWRCSSCRKY